MRAVSAQFTAAIRQSHRLAVQATIVAPDGDETEIAVTGGSVTLDSAAAVRGRCTATVVDDGTLGLVPVSAASALAPYGNELRLSRGLWYPDGSSELVSLGIFRIQDAQIDDAPEGLVIAITGLDRAQRIVDARFEEPYQVTAGTNYATAIEAVLQAAWPDIETDLTATALTTPSLVAQEGDDRWAFAQSMAAAISMTLYFDGDGVCVLRPEAQTDPVAQVVEGNDGVLVTAGRRWTREGRFNRVIATGENTGETAPARGVATDENPASPTYYFGPFGRVPRFYSSPFLTTDAQAESAAQSILRAELGTTEQVNFGSVVLPHLEPGDVVQITRERAGIDEEHILDTLTIPLAADQGMTGQTRAKQVLA